MTRKPIHTSTAIYGSLEVIVATCDDGTIWSIPARAPHGQGWTQLPPIPQPEPKFVQPKIVMVNGERFAVNEEAKFITYELICKMARKDLETTPIVTFHFEHLGETVMVNNSTITPGQSVRIEEGLVFTVTEANDAQQTN